ncbi:MAG: ribosomal protein S18-alanine N-acetyltransferase, partial [Nitrospirota bacterium]|nr:ribosomal protein S18-alanine N-acetyltransferase [Nitrospirota bacterium]
MTVHASKNWNIQVATLDNLDALAALEEACFSVPWSRKSFEAELEGNQFSRMLIVPHSEYGQKIQVLGYICVWMVFEEIRFLNLAVHQEFRRQGLATQLISQALHIGIEEGCCRGMLEVRASNQAARKLYESFHFQEYATRISYYTRPTEDGILMTLESLVPLYSERRYERGRLVGSQASITQFHHEPGERGYPMVTDEHIAENLRTSNEEYRELEESHHRLDAELQQLLKHHVLTPQEEVLKKQ